MKLTPEEREQLRQMFLIDVDVNLDRLIILTEKAMASKYDEEITKIKDEIIKLVNDLNTGKEIEGLFRKNLIPAEKIVM